MSDDITLSPFYHSAVNAVARPNKIVHCSQYFVARWMPLLGGNGTMIVLALRRGGFLDYRTGERRDEIIVTRKELARAAGISEDTLTRELRIDKRTGKPANEWLHRFVQSRRRVRRNHLGQVQQDDNAYWVSMDDPIHPDDWHLVEAAAHESGWRREKQPETQTAFPVDKQTAAPETQTAAPETQTAAPETQTAAPETQTASHLKSLDSSLPNLPGTTTDALAGSKDVVVKNSVFASEQSAPGPAEALEATAPEPSHEDRLYDDLVDEGMGKAQARAAVSDKFQEAQHQLANLRHALPNEKLSPPERGKWLYVAIKTGYGHTKGYARHLDEERKKSAARQAQDEREAVKTRKTAEPPLEALEFSQGRDVAEERLTRKQKVERDLALRAPEEQVTLRQRARNAMPTNMRLRSSGEVESGGRETMICGFLRTLLDGGEVADHGEWKLPNVA